jgi:hypothetical protein
MKWIKRLLIIVAFGLTLTVIASFVSYRMARGTPSWYEPEKLTDAQRAEADNQAIQRSLSLSSWAADLTNLQRRRAHGRAKPGEHVDPITVSLTEYHINSILATAGVTQGMAKAREKMSHYVNGGRIVLLDDEFVVAGQLKDAGFASDAIASLHFHPRIDDQGQLVTGLAGLYSGILPLPRSVLSGSEQKLRDVMQEDLPDFQARSRMEVDGTVNGKAVAAAMIKLALHALDNQPASAVIYLQSDPSDQHQATPVKLTALKIENKTLTFTLAPLSQDELAAVVPEIQKPVSNSQ